MDSARTAKVRSVARIVTPLAGRLKGPEPVMAAGRGRPAARQAQRRRPFGRQPWSPVGRSGSGVVELAALDESMRAVEDERVGCTGRGVGAGDALGLVVEVRKHPSVTAGLGDHL